MDYPVTAGTGMDREDRNYMRGLDDLLPDMKYILPRCDSDITMRKALSETAQQFCRDTGVFEYTATVALVNDTARYVIACPWPADILVVKDVWVEFTTNGLVTRSSLHPTAYVIQDPTDEDRNYIELSNAINVGSGTTAELKLALSIIPYFDQMIGTQAYALPDKFLRRWRSAFVQGAIARLAGMDGKPWTNKQLSTDARQQYMQLQGEAVNKSQIANMRQGSATCANPIGWF